ncbi:MAG: aromatic hydrocarbon degradation protein [Bacteroidota bacterium]|nr:aromatic hydrocarbon degradation protein [Bacteroidota bacterium]
MKKFLLLVINCFTAACLFAQEPADALRFSWTVPSGTARQQAIGGAMGSLGGDITATFINPAGLAFYKTGDLILSPAYRFGKSKSNYLNRKETEKEKNFVLGTTGFVIGSGNGRGRVKNTAFSIGFNTTANFNNDIFYRGSNNQTSFSQKYLEELQNDNIKDDRAASQYPFGTSLAINTYLVDTVGGGTSGNYNFQSRAKNLLPGELLQEQRVDNSGGIYEFALGGATNYNDRLMIGASFGLPILNYKRDATFTEADATANGNNKFNFASYTESLSTKGLGLNLKAGLIFKPQEFWRLGLAIHSPTFYSLTDNFQTSITADVEAAQGELTQSSTDFTNGSSEFKYMLITPYRVIGSVSYVLREIQDVTKQKGFLTADVEYVNYKSSSFHEDEENGNDQTTNDYLSSLNKAIDNAYKSAFNFRAGGELKFTTIMVRLGAAYYGNPYKNINGEKGSKLNLSGGLGYRNKGFFADLTYVHNIYKDVHFPYRLQNAAYSGAIIKSGISNMLMTLGWKF